jgi:hypothetical protein
MGFIILPSTSRSLQLFLPLRISVRMSTLHFPMRVTCHTHLISSHLTTSEEYCDVHAVGQQTTVETLVYDRCVATNSQATMEATGVFFVVRFGDDVIQQ